MQLFWQPIPYSGYEHCLSQYFPIKPTGHLSTTFKAMMCLIKKHKIFEIHYIIYNIHQMRFEKHDQIIKRLRLISILISTIYILGWTCASCYNTNKLIVQVLHAQVRKINTGVGQRDNFRCRG